MRTHQTTDGDDDGDNSNDSDKGEANHGVRWQPARLY
jgi:hypothetical protein